MALLLLLNNSFNIADFSEAPSLLIRKALPPVNVYPKPSMVWYFTDESTSIFAYILPVAENAITAVCLLSNAVWLAFVSQKSTSLVTGGVGTGWLLLVLFLHTPNKNSVAQQINNNGIFLLVIYLVLKINRKPGVKWIVSKGSVTLCANTRCCCL